MGITFKVAYMSRTEVTQQLSDITIFLGNLLDHFNTSLYAFMAPIMAPIFFPAQEPVVQLILGYSLLSSSLLTRPVGSLIFGMIAGKKGAILSLTISLIGVAVFSILCGCLPVYKTVGYFAPVSLIGTRIMIGVFASGESAVAKLYVVANKRSTSAVNASCVYESTVMLGIILAALVSTWVYYSGNVHAWRVGFVVGGMLGLCSALVRYYVNKSSFSQTTVATSNLGLWKYKKNILRVALVTGCSHITYNLVFILFPSLVPLVSNKINIATMFSLNNWLLLIDLLALLLLPIIILRYQLSYYTMMLVASCILAVSMIPVFFMLGSNSILIIMISNVWIIVFSVMFVCSLNIWSERLVTNLPEKYLIIGLGNSIGAAFIGRTVPVVCFWLWYKTANLVVLACYISVWILLAFSVLLFDCFSMKTVGRYLTSMYKLNTFRHAGRWLTFLSKQYF